MKPIAIDPSELTELLRQLALRRMAKLGITQIELAERMGTTQGTVSRLLRGDVRHSNHVPSLMDALRVKPSTVMALAQAQDAFIHALADVAAESPGEIGRFAGSLTAGSKGPKS